MSMAGFVNRVLRIPYPMSTRSVLMNERRIGQGGEPTISNKHRGIPRSRGWCLSR